MINMSGKLTQKQLETSVDPNNKEKVTPLSPEETKKCMEDLGLPLNFHLFYQGNLSPEQFLNAFLNYSLLNIRKKFRDTFINNYQPSIYKTLQEKLKNSAITTKIEIQDKELLNAAIMNELQSIIPANTQLTDINVFEIQRDFTANFTPEKIKEQYMPKLYLFKTESFTLEECRILLNANERNYLKCELQVCLS